MLILSHKKSGIVLKLWHVNDNSVDVMRLNILSLGLLDPIGTSRVNAISRRSTPEIVLSSNNLNFSSKVANWNYSTYSQVFLLTLCYHFSFIRNGDCQRSLSLFVILYVLSFNLRVLYHSN